MAPDAAVVTPLAAFRLALDVELALGVEVRDLAVEEVNLSSLGASNSLRMSPSMLWTRVRESFGNKMEVRKRVVTCKENKSKSS